jgi:RHS repeat-associated protein
VRLSGGSSTDYTYDALNRLTSEANNAAQTSYSASYQFDNVGNRLSYLRTDTHGFNDDFNRLNNLNVGTNWLEVAGDWQIDSNRLFMPNAETDAIIIYPAQSIPNPVITTTLKLETVGNKKGSYIIFSYQDQNDFYYAGLEGTSNLWVMGRYTNGTYNDLVTLSEPIDKLIDYHIKVTVNANTATLESLQNNAWVTKLTHTFPSLPQGKVGLSVEKSRTRFDDFKASWQVTTNTAYTYNQLNQLIQSTVNSPQSMVTTYAYDANGNLIQKIEGTNAATFNYDYENRLTAVNLPNGALAAYAYDGLGRRISKNINNNPTTYLYDAEDIIEEQTPADTAFFSHGPGIDNPISMLRQNQPYYYHTDGLGSITNLTNSASQPIQSYSYDAYGNILSQQGTLPNPYTYTSRELDSEAGLYYYRNRYYDPRLGRFITQDPLGMVNGPNLYTYVNNNPVNFVDPWGWCAGKRWAAWWIEIFVPGYGIYGGPFRTDPTFQTPPEDTMDELFMEHDKAWIKGEYQSADRKLLASLGDLPMNPYKWGKRPKNILKTIGYQGLAIAYFFWFSD